MLIELGKTYVTAAGDWAKIVSLSCAHSEKYPYGGDQSFNYTEDGECGIEKHRLVLEVPADQVVLRQVQYMLEDLASQDIGLKRLIEMRLQAERLIKDDSFLGLIKQAYR